MNDRIKGNALVYSRKWGDFSRAFLRGHPVCEAPGCDSPSTITDHIFPKILGGPDCDEKNAQALCRPCHDTKGKDERRGIIRDYANRLGRGNVFLLEAKMGPKDNATIRQKAALRREVLALVKDPLIMETHGGYGRLFTECYEHISRGIVFEKEADRCDVLAIQRPSWRVYQCKAETAISQNVAPDWAINILDADPHGSPWPTLKAFFSSQREFADEMFLAINDGYRRHARRKMAWKSPIMRPVCERFGNDVFSIYLKTCEWMAGEFAKLAEYELVNFAGYYCGNGNNMTHYAARLQRRSAKASISTSSGRKKSGGKAA